MMVGHPASSRRPPDTPPWVFRWRPRKSPVVPKLIAISSVGALFLLLITTLRIEVRVPEKSAPRKASVIHLGDDAESRALILRAREGGPFPARFEPSQWQGLVDLERTVLNAASFQPPAYTPKIAELPDENLVQPVELAVKGQAFFPKHSAVVAPAFPTESRVLAPTLYPLAGITAAGLPRDLPTFAATGEDALAPAPWRVMLRLHPNGSVEQCVSLEKGNDPAAAALVRWLERVEFPSSPNASPRWIALAIGFTNQPADGTDSH
jgi:hypothetical protein